MKTLDEVEARTPISAADLPLSITQSGSYYFTESMTFSTLNADAITISASGVTIDLNGFTLTGPGKAAGSTGSGIYAEYVDNIVIKNGVIREWRRSGVQAYFNCNHVIVTDLIVENNGYYGAAVGYASIVQNIISRDNDNIGIQVSERCIVEHCTVSENNNHGIYILNRTTVRNCSVYLNTYEGITGFSNNVIQNNTISNNRMGINLSARNLIDHNSSCSNSEEGIRLSNDCNQVTHNLVTNNSEHGIYASGDYNRIAHNTLSYNRNVSTPSMAGIFLTGGAAGTHIEGNVVTYNNFGIDTDAASDNLIIGNRANNNDTDFQLGGSNSYGPIVNATGGGVLTTSDPYANIYY